MFSGNDVSLADIAAVTKNNDDGFGNGGSLWAILLLILILGRGFGYGDNNGGGYPSTVATSGEVQRAFDYAGTSSKLDNISSSIGCGFNDVVSNINATGNVLQNAIQANAIAAMQNTNNITSQLSNMAATNAACCCENKTLIQSSFADLNYNLATQACQTRQAIADNARSVLEALQAQTISQKDEKIAELTSAVNALNLAASQQAQNNYLISQLKTPTPVPAYITASPYTSTSSCPCAYTS